MNLPNKLTLSRFLMVPFFVLFMGADDIGLSLGWQLAGRLISLILFITASITDYYDGALARRHNLVTNFGRLMDPLADKLLTAAAFVILVEENVAPAWMVITVLCREFLVTGLRMLGTSQGRVIQADRWGKNKTISQMVAIITSLVLLALRDILRLAGGWQWLDANGYRPDMWMYGLLYALMLFTTILTVVSGWLYFSNNRDLLKTE